jgi:hypothetical protein
MRNGPALLRAVADGWDEMADKLERLMMLPGDASPARVIRWYGWAAAMLRAKADSMELERFVE